MNYIEEQLKTKIKNTIGKLYDINDDKLIMIEIPKDNNNGDYASNIAMRLARVLKKPPLIIAEEIKEDLSLDLEMIEIIAVANPGFINFRLKKSYIASIINMIIDADQDYGNNEVGKGQKILVEYVSANPTGNLHLGHARGAAWGDAITRLLNKSGYDCLREYYINDAGAQILNLAKSLYARYAQLFGINIALPEDGYYGEDVKIIAEELKNEIGDTFLNKFDENIEFFKNKAKEKELAKIKKDLELFRVHFDSWISEQKLYDDGKVIKVIKDMQEKKLTYIQDDALWFKTTNYGDDKDRVLIKADGSYTYLTPDIANHLDKINRGYDKLIDLWGADHHGYIPRMKAALKSFGYSENTLEVDIIQMVRLVEDGKEVKMSKRTGNAITIRELCDDIGVDAARYFFVSRAADTHLDFDLSLARKKTNENPVYYVQYAYARICSILRQVDEFKKNDVYDLLVNEKEIDLLKLLNEFPFVIADAALNRSPNKICNYVQKLATYFHSFYNSCKVINLDDPILTNQRLNLLLATKIVLKNALDLIAINSPEKM